ncbi:hypothetical protein Scep_006828 [Stephania cephalantha]|uniref:Uncharacterized protein n=1 Tax=Stephania cephalantha TaxID=152367 RepID=A0AAP0K8P9_9MAGN
MRWMSHGRNVGGILLMRKGMRGDREGRNSSNGIEATLPRNCTLCLCQGSQLPYLESKLFSA